MNIYAGHDSDVSQSTPRKKRKTESSISDVPEEIVATGSLGTDESAAELARLDRNYIFKSLLSESKNDTFSSLNVMLTPVLITALVDDAHDVHIRACRQKQYQQLHTSKRSKKGMTHEDQLGPAEVFISASPDVGKFNGLCWSVHRILHDPAFEEFMLKNAAPRNKKKLASQLKYNSKSGRAYCAITKTLLIISSLCNLVAANTLLTTFDSLCHTSIDDESAANSLHGNPLLYHDEVVSLQSSGLLHRISHSSDEFMHHHCNARHLLR